MESEGLLLPPGPDDQQVGGGRRLQQNLAWRPLPLGGAPVHLHGRVLCGHLVQRGLQGLGGPLFVLAGRLAREEGVVGGLVRGAPPSPYGLQYGPTSLRLLEGEAHGRRTVRLLADAEQDAPARHRLYPLVMAAAQHDHRAGGTGGHGQADGTEQELGDTAAPPRPQDEGGGVGPLPHQVVLRFLGQYLGGHLQIRFPGARPPGGAVDDAVGEHRPGRLAEVLGRRGTFVPLQQRGMHQPQRHPAQGGLVRRPVDGPQTRLGSVHAHDQREFHGAVVHLVHGGFF
ncbi:hypothetical protein GCM10010309_02660 [Streptomyces violaceochromogenes]|nr:hypothetical protein GCM10010309_02660 [Streptomyces violaceochromogenes]